MPNTNIYTENPLFTAGVGEDVTATEEQMNEEYKNSPITFREKYGDALFNAYTQQAAALGKQASAEGAAAARSLGEAIQDSMINLGAGAFGGTVDLFAGLAGVGGALGSEKSKELAEWLSSGSQAIYEGADSWASSAQDAQKRAYAARQQALKNRTDRQRREDLANGTSEVVANARHIARNFFGGAGNILEDGGMLLNMGSQALGSMVPSWIASAGIGAAAKGLKAVAAKTVPDAVDTAVDVADASNKFTQYLAKSAPWMAASGAVEGGGAYAQQLQEGLSTPITTLIDHSPEFNSRVTELMKQGIPQPQAQEQARRDMAFAAAEQAGIRTAATAAITGAMTAKLAKPFERSGRWTQRLGEGLTEPLEETITEGATQYHQNVATKDFLDARKNVVEDLGQSAAEGLVGGLGVTGLQMAPQSAIDAIGEVGSGIAGVARRAWDSRSNSIGKIEQRATASVDAAQRAVEAAGNTMPPIVQGSTQDRNLTAIIGDLPGYNEAIFKRRPNNNGYAITSDDAVNILDQIQRDKEIVSATPDDGKAELKKTKENTLKSLNEFERGVQWFLHDMITTQRANHKSGTPLDETELLGEAQYFSSLATTNLDRAKKEFFKRPKGDQVQLRGFSSKNSTIQRGLNLLFDRNKNVSDKTTANRNTANTSRISPVAPGTSTVNASSVAQGTTADTSKTTTSTISSASPLTENTSVPLNQENKSIATESSEETSTAEPTTEQSQFSAQTSNNPISITEVAGFTDKDFDAVGFTESFEQVASEEIKANPEQEAGLASDGSKAFSYRKNGDIYIERNGKTFKVPKEIANTLLNQNASTEDSTAAQQRINKALARSTGDVFNVKLSDNRVAPVEVNNGIIYGNGVNIPLTEDERDTYNWEGTTQEEKRDIVRQALERGLGFAPTRHAETLDPTLLEKQGYFWDSTDRQAKPYAPANVIQRFKEVMGEFLSSLIVPVKRPLLLWDAESPVQALRDFIKDPNNVKNLFRENKFTNSAIITEKLYTREEVDKKGKRIRRKHSPLDQNTDSFFNGKVSSPDEEINYLMKHGSLADQIMGMTNPKGTFAPFFYSNFSLEFDEDTPQAVKDFFEKTNSKILEKFKKNIPEICLLASIQSLARLGDIPHMLNETEMQRYGYDPETLWAALGENILSQVIEPMATQTIMTSIRKMLGVAISNDATEKEYSEILGFLALRTARALINQGALHVRDFPIKMDDGTESGESIKGVSVDKAYKDLFRAKGDILEALLDPNYKNTWSDRAFEAVPYMLHINARLRPAAVANIRRENMVEGRVDRPLFNLFRIAGHPADYEERNVAPYAPFLGIGGANDSNRGLYNGNTYESEMGRQINARLAFEQLEEIAIVGEATNRNVEDVPVFYDNAAVRSGRVMQIGAATPQGNKILRVAISYADNPNINLKDENVLSDWKLALAQSLGAKVSDKSVKESLKQADAFIEHVKSLLKTEDFADFYQMIQGVAPELRKKGNEYIAYDEIVQQVMDAANKQDIGLQVNDIYGINGLVEVVRYLNASEVDHGNFHSNLTLEIDGKSDGPSNINTFLGSSMGAFTRRWAKTSYKTGNFYGVNATTQGASTADSLASKVLGTGGNDLHSEVAKEAIPEKIKLRMMNAINTLKGKKTAAEKAQAKHFLTVLHHIIEIYRLRGKVSFNPIKLTYSAASGKTEVLTASLAKTSDPLTFDRELSKVLTTIIPYGSAVTGSSRNLVDQLLTDIYQNISNDLKDIAYGRSKKTVNEELKLLKELFRFAYNKRTGAFSVRDSIPASEVKHLVPNYPAPEAIDSEAESQGGMIGHYDKEEHEFIEEDSIRNFTVTPSGIDHLTELFIPVFGEPAHSAVTEVLGEDAMRGAQLIATVSEILTIVSQGVQTEELNKAGGDFRNLTQKALYKVQQTINRFSPRYDFPSGVTAFVRKENYITNQNTLVKDSKTGLSIYPSHSKIISSGVSGSPLTVQAMGDASTIMYFMSALAREGLKGAKKVFDGVYVPPGYLETMATLLNESSSLGQKQLAFKVVENTLVRVGKDLKKRYKNLENLDPIEAVTVSVANFLSGSTLSGDVRSGDKTEQTESYKRLHASIQDFFSPKAFIDDMNILRKEARGGRIHSRDYKTNDKDIKAQLTYDLRNLFDELATVVLNEEIQHETLNRIPKAIQHMSGPEVAYLEKNPISVSKAEKLLAKYNALPGVKAFADFEDMMVGFLNRLAREEVIPEIVKKYKLTDQQVEKLNRLTGRNEGNSGYFELTDDGIYKELKDLFEVTEKEPFFSQNKSPALQEVDRDIIKNAFDTLGKNKTPEGVYRSLYNKIQAILPENTRVFFAGSKNNLPAKVRNKFTNPKQKAIYVQENGESRIYILDESTIYDARQPEIAELIAHEATHAAVGYMLHMYYNGSDSLTNEQKSAIQNLERLLEDFMNEDAWQGKTPAPQIVRLREILSGIKDPAERMDEAIAYICTNGRLMNAIAERQLKDGEQHRKRFWDLVKQVVTAAQKAWKKLIRIVTNSPTDKALSFDQAYREHFADPVDFLTYWGTNTLILVNAEQQINPDDRLKRRSVTKNIVRAGTSLEPGKGFFRKSDFFKALRNITRSRVLFDTVSQKGIYWGKNLSQQKVGQAYKEELAKILSYRELILSHAKNFLENPEDFADAVVAFMTRGIMTQKDEYLLFRMQQELMDKLNEYSFISDPIAATKEELDDSVAIYKLLDGSSTFYERLPNELPDSFNPEAKESAIFLALALTQNSVSNAIGKVQINEPTKKQLKITDPLESLGNLSDEILTKWTKELADNKTISDSLKVVLEEGEQLAKGTDIDLDTKNFFKSVDRILAEGIAGLTSLFNKDFGENLREMFKTINDYPILGYFQTTETIRKGLNQFQSTKVASLVKDIYGRTPSLTDVEVSFKRVKGYLDRWRKDTLEEDPELLKKQFKNHKITTHLKRFLHRTILRTGIHTLDEKVAQKVLTNESELDLEIDRVGNQIKELSSEYGDLYIQKCRQLANYLTGNRQAGHNLLTSPEAISRLLGETSVAMVEAPEGIVPLLGQMISLLSIKNFTEGDRSFMQDLFKTDKDAMLSMIRQYKEVMEAEERKVAQTKNKYYPYNYLFGWMPKGASATGRLVYATRDQVKFYEKQGYTNLGRYQNSNIDPSEPVFRMYCKHPLEQEYQEGLFQGINQTSKGMLHKNLSRNEMEGTIVQDSSLYEDIYKNFDKEATGNGLIPIYDDEGFVIGYERSVMPEDRALIEDGVDFFSAMAQMKTRQDRELAALDINKQAVKMAWDTYNNAPEDYKKNFIDVTRLEDPNIKKALARLDWGTKQEIKKYFGDHLYLLADEVNTYLGYPRPKLTDLWDNSFFFPENMQKQMVKCLEAVLGKQALYKVGRAEEVLNIVVSYARDTIVIRSGVVPLVNALSNTLLLWLVFGMPLPMIAKYYTDAVVFTNRYNRLVKKHRELLFKANNATDPKVKASYQEQAKKIDKEIRHLPIYRLIKEGEYSTISAEGAEYEGANYAKAVIDEKFNAMLDTLGKGDQIKTAVSNILMTKNSMTYQTMNEIVNMSDWAAKCAGYWYLTEHSNKFSPVPIDHSIARNLVSTLFVDYDQLAGRARDWLNRTGLTWFLTYKYRMIAASLMVMHLNPSRTIMGTIMESVLPTNLLGGTPLSENLLSKILSGDISYSLTWDMMFRGLLMHPAALFFGLLLV